MLSTSFSGLPVTRVYGDKEFQAGEVVIGPKSNCLHAFIRPL